MVLGEVLGLLSGVEEVEVKVRMLVTNSYYWGLEDRETGWLGGSVVGDGGRRRWRRVERRLVVYKTAEEGGKQAVFFRKEEV